MVLTEGSETSAITTQTPANYPKENILQGKWLLTQKLFSNKRVIHTHFVVYFHRNAVRSNAGEDRTVPHTVPLRAGAPQKHACAYSF